MNQISAWLALEDLLALSDTEIIARITLGGDRSPGLPSISAHLAKDKLRSVLKSVYVPSHQVLRIIVRALVMIQDHYLLHYASPLDYRRGINSLRSPVPTALPLCLTGLPGVGKTELAMAIVRLIQDQFLANIGDDYAPALLTPCRYIKITAGSSLLNNFGKIVFGDAKNGNKLTFDDLTGMGARKLYREGLAMLILDEMHLIARGTNASVNIVKLLTLAADCGPPQFHISNFRNVGKIMGSGWEVTGRLMTECVVMTPELSDDPAELELRRVYEAVTCGVVPNDGEFWSHLNAITFRVHRTRIHLLSLAFEITRTASRSVISIADLKSAALTSQFAVNRLQVDVLSKMAIDGKTPKGHKDLVCPLGAHFAFPSDAKQAAIAAEETEIDAAVVRSSLTPAEAKAIDDLEDKENKSIKQTKKRRPKADYDSLLASVEGR
ncbi:ATPase associated with various cellular activities family protein [Hydrogenophaga sp. RAC07]|mgnify:CR=1 FL=1|uniref:ATP-binding protein n=1 Tax=Hydrogenophaga sp. RAC07 TaxID=1842537 RepID=UPI00083D6116|nr:ATP-binding protein [Hydrogenophaga sp. RAC07]AOF86798.1 ATPase associated with various cellular activities family protein [Hydrogenophaga sp. RAC07]